MARRERTWEMDWAGPHGTAWGTVNACLTTITAAWVTHLVHVYWPASTGSTILAAIGATVLGMIATLLRAAFSGVRQSVTVVYKLACWFGVGVWLVVMLHSGTWTIKWFLAHVGALIVLALIAGICAGLAADDPTPAAASRTATATSPAALPATSPAQAARDALAIEWEMRADLFCDGDGYTVPNIEHWPRGNGYSVEIVAPAGGGRDYNSILSCLAGFGADLNLVHGGAIKGAMGRTRRIAIIDVTTHDLLADDTDYPTDRAVHSIRDDLDVGHRDDGNPGGPNLWQNCMLLAGESGSGKTNAAHVLTAEIVTTCDGLLWMWELTGGGLWSAWMNDWLRGVYDEPPIDWCAFDDQELLWQSRAAIRIGYARKPGYKQLMLDADDDKLPVSADVPEIVVMGDEIARVTGNMSDHEEAKENLRLICFELRAAAVRAVFLALRGTDDVISSSIQSQCQVRVAMKVNTKAEAMFALGPGHDFGPEDTPYPGSSGIVPGSGEPVYRLKWHRQKPSQIRVIARTGSTRRPVLDELSRIAANGRQPDGTPMADLLPGELDCYDTRWDRFRAWSNANGSAPRATTAPSTTRPTPTQPVADASAAQAEAAINAALTAVDERIAELNGGRDDDDIDDEFARLMEEEGFGDDWVIDQSYDETPAQPTDRQAMLDLIQAAGSKGIKPVDLLGELATSGVIFSRDTLHSRLNDLLAAGLVHRPSFGRWAIGPKS